MLKGGSDPDMGYTAQRGGSGWWLVTAARPGSRTGMCCQQLWGSSVSEGDGVFLSNGS